MAKAKRPRFKINDRVTIASYTPLVPAYGGKPFVGRETILRVSSIAGKGSLRDPYFVHVTDDAGHFWQFPPDDIVLAEESLHHAARRHATKRRHTAKRSPTQLDREIAEALAQTPGMTAEQIERYRSGRKWGWPAELAFKVATGRPLSRTPKRARKDYR